MLRPYEEVRNAADKLLVTLRAAHVSVSTSRRHRYEDHRPDRVQLRATPGSGHRAVAGAAHNAGIALAGPVTFCVPTRLRAAASLSTFTSVNLIERPTELTQACIDFTKCHFAGECRSLTRPFVYLLRLIDFPIAYENSSEQRAKRSVLESHWTLWDASRRLVLANWPASEASADWRHLSFCSHRA